MHVETADGTGVGICEEDHVGEVRHRGDAVEETCVGEASVFLDLGFGLVVFAGGRVGDLVADVGAGNGRGETAGVVAYCEVHLALLRLGVGKLDLGYAEEGVDGGDVGSKCGLGMLGSRVVDAVEVGAMNAGIEFGEENVGVGTDNEVFHPGAVMGELEDGACGKRGEGGGEEGGEEEGGW